MVLGQDKIKCHFCDKDIAGRYNRFICFDDNHDLKIDYNSIYHAKKVNNKIVINKKLTVNSIDFYSDNESYEISFKYKYFNDIKSKNWRKSQDFKDFTKKYRIEIDYLPDIEESINFSRKFKENIIFI